ncbi:MAG: radical SAM protein [Olsenella sp.]|nr:radical SAM protein [Olsenella sp.]MCI2186936.1 radical SAM protein [Olsenella sp.]
MRQLPENIVRFTCSNIPMLGNFDNGCIIGLSESGNRLCDLYEQELIDDVAFAKADSRLFEALRSHGFLHPTIALKAPITSYIHVTHQCNLSCKGCYSKQEIPIIDPSFSSIKKMLNFLTTLEVRNLNISGGEPLLRKDIYKIVDYSKSIGIERVDVITNGTMRDDAILHEIAPIVDAIHISLGSYDQNDQDSIKGPGLFSEVIANIKAMLDMGIDVHLLPTIHSKNINDIPQYVGLANQLGVAINFSILSCSACNRDLGDFAFDEPSLVQLANVIIDSIKQTGRSPILIAKRSCQAGKKLFSVAVNGDIFPCHMLHSPVFKMGNAIASEWYDDSDYSTELKALFDFDAGTNRHCHKCEYRYLCGGGCRARAYSSGNTICDMDPYCSLLGAFFRTSMNHIIT